jgi:hypothetical protein
MRKKWTAIHLEDLKEKFPNLNIDESKCKIVNVTDLHYQVNNEEYYYSSVSEGTYKRNTEYAWQKEFLNEINEEFKIIESGCYIYLVSNWESSLGANVSVFWKDNGKRIRGKRSRIKVHESNKGLYIILNKKRVYI